MRNRHAQRASLTPYDLRFLEWNDGQNAVGFQRPRHIPSITITPQDSQLTRWTVKDDYD